MEENEFRELLKNHDWFYYMADDSNAYHKGQREHDRIMAIIRNHPELKKIYEEMRK